MKYDRKKYNTIHPRMLKKTASKAAASEEARRTLRYVEPLSDARTPLADFFSILLTGFAERNRLEELGKCILWHRLTEEIALSLIATLFEQ